MKKLATILLLLLVPIAVFAAVYQWTDDKGNVHFSDVPQQGAKKIEVKDAQTYSPVNLPAPPQTKPDSVEEKRIYRSVQVTQPANEATIRNNNGSVAVSVRVEPGLFEGDLLQLYFDGSAVGKPQSSTVFVLNNIYRGEHNISVSIVDSKGKDLLKSDSITIYMHRARVGQAR